MMILDTNVVSELMRPAPSTRVVDWIAAQPARSLYTTSITEAEILHGVMLLPSGKKRKAFEAAAKAMFREEFAGRVLSFDTEAALPYAIIAVERRRAGRPISHFDAQIAAIARSTRAAVATRNVADFQGCGVDLVNPWEE
jgi:predicted nucleic acid-binding protein